MHVHVSPHDTYTLYVYLNIKLSLQLSVVTFSFSHVHSSPHISFITITFTSKLTVCKFLYCSYTCDATCISCGYFSLASPPGSLLHVCSYCMRQPLNPPKTGGKTNLHMARPLCIYRLHTFAKDELVPSEL